MKLTNRSEYAFLALIYLGRLPEGTLAHAEDIAEAQGIPKHFLQQILHALKLAKLVRSVKGKQGGYALGKAPGEITLAEIVRLLEGALAPTGSASKHFYEPSPIEREKRLLGVMKKVRTVVAEVLEEATLLDVL